jgi:hypothetical protein
MKNKLPQICQNGKVTTIKSKHNMHCILSIFVAKTYVMYCKSLQRVDIHPNPLLCMRKNWKMCLEISSVWS